MLSNIFGIFYVIFIPIVSQFCRFKYLYLGLNISWFYIVVRLYNLSFFRTFFINFLELEIKYFPLLFYCCRLNKIIIKEGF